VEDGQNKLARNATDFEALEKKLYYQYLVYKNEALALSGTAATTQNWIVRKASPSYDPVSNI
jgi:hypothetical protein